jgi:hypothetical protein
MNLVRATPDKEKAESILSMVETTIEMIGGIDKSRFPSNVTKEYYEIIRELISIILLLDGYRTTGEGAHKRMIEYLESHYKEFQGNEISLIDDLRIVRNKIAYDGFFVRMDYVQRKIPDIQDIISKLKKIISRKLGKDEINAF